MIRVVAAAVAIAVVGCGGAPSGQRVSFGTKDGFQIEGQLYGQGTKGVVLAPDATSGRDSWSSVAGTLAGKGYRVLAFDFRGRGGSSGQPNPATADRDVTAAVEFARSQGATRVVVVGAGLGGLAALKAAGQRTVVEGLVTVSAPIEAPGLQLGSELATVLVPKLFMVTEGDAPARAAADQLLAQAPEPRTLQVYAGRGTGVSVLAAPGAFDALLAFVQQVAP